MLLAGKAGAFFLTLVDSELTHFKPSNFGYFTYIKKKINKIKIVKWVGGVKEYILWSGLKMQHTERQ